jgi:3-oxoacyl-[acyl-carrier-protein] synthase II
MECALRDASLNAGDIGYINAHGTSTPANDRTETKAIRKAFGDHAKNIGVSSTKSMLGHMLGAAGAVEAGVTALAIYERIIPPTINLDNADPECDLDYTPLVSRRCGLRAAVSNSLGFGGMNAALVLKKYLL